MSDVELTRALERGEIDNETFHHASHLRVAWVYLSESRSVDEAAGKIRDTLRRFAASLGKLEKYHETITLFWLHLLAQAHASGSVKTLEQLVQANPRLLEKDFPLAYYSAERLFSDYARTAWVEPDLKPLSLDATAPCSSNSRGNTPDRDFCQRTARSGFTLSEVLIALAISVVFVAAVFETNGRLLLALKTQKEATAATMMLQERMEAFRSLAYSGIATNSTSATTNPPTTAADIVANTTTSESALGNLTETITVGPYLASPNAASTTTHTNSWQRNATYPTGTMTDTVGSFDLAGNYDLLKVDVQVSWTTAGGRSHTRSLSTICGRGNRGP
jgi:prepilin-type N-terminal cleavage/methylation domain-containing protein